jgi:hypothetical protein
MDFKYNEYRIYHETNGTFSVYGGRQHPSGGFFAVEILYTNPLISECYAYLQAINTRMLIRK